MRSDLNIMQGQPKLVLITDQDDPSTVLLEGWRGRVYRLGSSGLQGFRTTFEPTPGLIVTEYRMQRGAARVDARIDPGRLMFNFIELEEGRLLGNLVACSVLSVAYDGSHWEGSFEAPMRIVSLNLAGELARRVVPVSLAPALRDRMRGPQGLSSLLAPVTPRARLLKSLLEHHMGRAPPCGPAGAAQAISPVPGNICDAAGELIAEILQVELPVPYCSSQRRRELAIAVERLLWENPQSAHLRRLSLDDAARRFGCSRRSIQMALHEQLGLGFAALKRAIRLQQVDAALAANPRSVAIAQLARAHEFNHLSRFSCQYREMFGVLPSERRSAR
jgi:AraC-like DNA-binding protein